MAQKSDYRALLVKARKAQLRLTVENLHRLMATYDAAADRIIAQILQMPDSELTERYLHDLLNSLNAEIARLASDNAALLTAAMLEIAQNAAERQQEIGEMLDAPADALLDPWITHRDTLTDGTVIEVHFGHVAQAAVERVAARVYGDGLALSDRLWSLDETLRRTVADTLVQGIAEQLSASNLADRLLAALSQPGQETPRYLAMRIARTEINNAHREASVMAATDPRTGQTRDYLLGMRWNLSLSHVVPDICDLWAAHDSGDGPGIYAAGDVPVDHPHGLCYVTPVLREYPEVRGPGKEPDVDAVPDSQVDYYAGQGDVAAVAAQEMRSNAE